MCYYEIKGGQQNESPKPDELLTLKITMLNNVAVSLIIGESQDADWVDRCTGLAPGEIYFARHPFKIFLLIECRGQAANYLFEMQYKKEADLLKFSNSKKCMRQKNKESAGDDPKIGSTVRGDFGFGFATDSAMDANQNGNQGTSQNTDSNTESKPVETNPFKPTPPTYNSMQFNIALHDPQNNYPPGIVSRQTLRKLDDSKTILEDFVSPMLIAIFMMLIILYVQLKHIYKNNLAEHRARAITNEQIARAAR